MHVCVYMKWSVSRSVMSDSLWPPQTVAHQDSLESMGFSREEYWSGLSFPSPICMYIHIYEKVKVLVTRLCLTLCNRMDCSQLAPLSMEFSRQEYWNVQTFPSPGDLPAPGIEPRSPTLQVDSLPSEPPGKIHTHAHTHTHTHTHTHR